MGDPSIHAEFEEAEREATIEEIRIRREYSLTSDQLLEAYFDHLAHVVEWTPANVRSLRQIDDPEREAMLDRLAAVFGDGP